MDLEDDVYKSIAIASDSFLVKERKSKFIGYAYPITTESEVKPIIEALKKTYSNANHVCYAWQLGVAQIRYRANDDGEPSNSAGAPIYGQIQAFGITNVLVAVVRIFGGVKLGVGGLKSAYKEAAKGTLENSKIITEVISETVDLYFDYKEMDVVMRIIKQHKLKICEQNLNINCHIRILVRKKMLQKILRDFHNLHKVKIQTSC